ncbi:MAG: 50S ribosomal protein L15 [Pseudomonadota bacterium]|jgi:large subunit ribosomal protein L15|nr:50S ribosomal protein L15 [Gammaproteobacteria bacterium]MEC8466520.1 50S ribosomal protein L15 [Pseudomonadota bacterium]|tara:strand:+ start:1491 stop:1913 length:423 start_codon:yes stop_codon:yes gene_type:complete
MKLNTLKSKGTVKNPKRVGRGIGSGSGKTAGRGHKGQKSRSGGNIPRGFEGGQMPLQQRIPKFGFSSRKNSNTAEINLKNLVGLKEVSIAVLLEMKFISKSIKQVRVYGDAKLDSPMSFEGIYLTKGAAESVKNAGGKIK